MIESHPDFPPRSGADESLSAPTPSKEACSAVEPQVIKLIRSAKLIAGKRELLCIVRGLSEAGVSVDLLVPVPLHGSLLLELGTGRHFPVTVEYSAGNRCQLRFLDPQDRQKFLHESQDELVRRPLRLRTEEEVEIVVGSLRHPATLCDVSQFGAGIRCTKLLHLGETILLEMGVLPPTPAKVAWRKREVYGLSFLQHYSLAQISDAFSGLGA